MFYIVFIYYIVLYIIFQIIHQILFLIFINKLYLYGGSSSDVSSVPANALYNAFGLTVNVNSPEPESRD